MALVSPLATGHARNGHTLAQSASGPGSWRIPAGSRDVRLYLSQARAGSVGAGRHGRGLDLAGSTAGAVGASLDRHAEIERVHFIEFGDFALKFLVSYYVTVADYGAYLDTQQTINFAIKDAFDREGIDMAFPTSTVYVKSEKTTNVPFVEIPKLKNRDRD